MIPQCGRRPVRESLGAPGQTGRQGPGEIEMTTQSVEERRRAAKLPPRWFIRAAWVVHRAIYRFTGGRRGLAHPKPGGRFGYLRLRTIGRHSGRERAVILGYYED